MTYVFVIFRDMFHKYFIITWLSGNTPFHRYKSNTYINIVKLKTLIQFHDGSDVRRFSENNFFGSCKPRWILRWRFKHLPRHILSNSADVYVFIVNGRGTKLDSFNVLTQLFFAKITSFILQLQMFYLEPKYTVCVKSKLKASYFGAWGLGL